MYIVLRSLAKRPRPIGSRPRPSLLTLTVGLLASATALLGFRDVKTRSEATFRQVYRASRSFPYQAEVAVDLPLKITLGLMEGQHRIRFSGKSTFNMEVGGRTFRGTAGQTWSVLLVWGNPAQSASRTLLARVPFNRRGEAEALAQSWEGRGETAQVLPMGILLKDRETGRILNDSRCFYVALPPESSWTAAWKRCSTLTATGMKPTVFEQLLQPQVGEMALVSPTGKVVGRGRSVRIESAQPVTVYNVEHDRNLPQHGFETRAYHGPLEVVICKSGKLAITDILDVEEYLKGVVPSEIYESDPPDTIRAQAVAARSELLAGLGLTDAEDPFDTCSDQHCQAYKGVGLEGPRSARGVEETRGQVLKFGNTILQAVYSDTCGGYTENLENVWSLPPHPAMKGHPDTFDAAAPPANLSSENAVKRFLEEAPGGFCTKMKGHSAPCYRWREKKSVGEISSLVSRRVKVGRVTDLIPLERGVSGRILRLKVVGTTGEGILYKGLEIRQLLGGLKSALFRVTKVKDARGRVTQFVFDGAGWGHGVGLCQSGARGRAESGQNYRQILGHYFSKSVLARIY